MSFTPKFLAAGGVGFVGRRALTPVLVVGGAFGSAAWFGVFEIATGVLEFVMQHLPAVQVPLVEGEKNLLQAAWARYVLIRPEMDLDGLKNSTALRPATQWTWEQRTPGTARTILISAIVVPFVIIILCMLLTRSCAAFFWPLLPLFRSTLHAERRQIRVVMPH